MKVLFFAPHAELWVHAFPEALVAEMLADAGNDVVYVGCGGALKAFCVPMAAHNLRPSSSEEDRQAVCARCKTRDATVRENLGLAGPRLSELLEPEDQRDVDALLEGRDSKELIGLNIDGVSVGSIALYQLMIRSKRLGVDLNPEEFAEYREELRSTLLSFMAARKLLARERPDRVVVYNGLYSVNRVVCKLAEKQGVPHYFLHAGGNLSNRLQTLWLGRGDTFSFFPHLVARWPEFADRPCKPEQVEAITNHYFELLRGLSPFAYSSPKSHEYRDVRQIFGVDPSQRLLVATLGSYDEERAAEVVGARVHTKKPQFATQIDWVRSLARFFSSRPDLFLVLRVHPREFPNKRDAVLSHHATELKQAFETLPDNVAVNWPNQRLSMYDLADQTDVFLNSWSSVGKEMALLGIPTVLYEPELAFYPAELGYAGTTEASYYAAVERALADGWSFERSRRAYRWYTLEFIRAVLFVGDSFPKGEGFKRGLVQRTIEQIDRRLMPGFAERWDCTRRTSNTSTVRRVDAFFRSGAKSLIDIADEQADETTSVAVERRAIRENLSRLAKSLYPSAASRTRSRLYHRLIGEDTRTARSVQVRVN